MGVKKLFASMGIGGASVETVLDTADVVPGGIVQGEVHIQGGSVAQQIQGLSVGLLARVEVEGGDEELRQDIEFHRVPLGGAFELQPQAVHAVPFGLDIPWETPITMFQGHELRGMHIGVTTELAIARAIDSSDLDPVRVHPLPAQQAILESFGSLGFRFRTADLERGQVRGTRQQLPFYQEVEFSAPGQYRGLNDVEVTFLADGREMDVVLEMDKKGGVLTEGSDSYRCFQVDLHNFQHIDWTAHLNQWLTEVGGRRNWL